MQSRKEISRDTWSADGRYLIRAYAKVIQTPVLTRTSGVLALVQVFDGDPSLTGKPEIFLSSSKLNGIDLLDELQNAEKIGRDFIAGIPRSG